MSLIGSSLNKINRRNRVILIQNFANLICPAGPIELHFAILRSQIEVYEIFVESCKINYMISLFLPYDTLGAVTNSPRSITLFSAMSISDKSPEEI